MRWQTIGYVLSLSTANILDCKLDSAKVRQSLKPYIREALGARYSNWTEMASRYINIPPASFEIRWTVDGDLAVLNLAAKFHPSILATHASIGCAARFPRKDTTTWSLDLVAPISPRNRYLAM